MVNENEGRSQWLDQYIQPVNALSDKGAIREMLTENQTQQTNSEQHL